MRFSSLTVLALVASGASAFTPASVQSRFVLPNMPLRKLVSLNMAADNKIDTSTTARKKTKKEELLEEINQSVRAAEARRQALEAELAAAEVERIDLLKKAERAAATPEPREVDFSGFSGAASLIVGSAVAAVAARSTLENRGEKQEEFRRKQQIAKAAAELDARNRAAAEARTEAAKNSVSENVHSFCKS